MAGSLNWTKTELDLDQLTPTDMWDGLVDVATIVLAVAVVRLSYQALRRDRARLTAEPIACREVNGLWVFRVRIVNSGLRDACLKPIILGRLHGKKWGVATTHVFCGNKANYNTNWDLQILESARQAASLEPHTPDIKAGFREDITIVCQPKPGESEYLEVSIVPFAGDGITQNLVPAEIGFTP